VANILLIVGSTGGHIYPAISITKNQNHNYFILAPYETKNKIDLNLKPIFFKKQLELKKISFPINFINNLLQTKNIISEKKIDLVLCFGSIYSIVGIVSKIINKPLVIMDQNVLPGRATRLLSNLANLTIVPFKESLQYISKKTKTLIMLTPIRKELYNKTKETKEEEILFMGGSLGAKTINNLALEFIKNKKHNNYKKVNIITGKKLYNDFLEELKLLKNLDLSNVNIIEYCQNIEELYQNSKIVISRSGGSTIAEILYLKKRAIVIPFPYALDNHQYYNAVTAKKYTNFIEFMTEPIEFKEFIEKLENIEDIIPKYKEEINFFDYNKFFQAIEEFI